MIKLKMPGPIGAHLVTESKVIAKGLLHFNLKKKWMSGFCPVCLKTKHLPPNEEVPHKDKVLFSSNENKEL